MKASSLFRLFSLHFKMRIFNTENIVLQFLFSLPLARSQQQQPLLLQDASTTATSSWNLNFSSSAPHYFASAYGLLQQWSNTFFPNGHSIVPCEIPPLTKLYHGRLDADVPPSPEVTNPFLCFSSLILLRWDSRRVFHPLGSCF
jgi:hypothetical protein